MNDDATSTPRTAYRCAACLYADLHPHHAIYYASCLTCEVRSVSQAPKHVRDAFYARISDPDARESFKRSVQQEYRRRKAASP